jgi:hypothetical protein
MNTTEKPTAPELQDKFKMDLRPILKIQSGKMSASDFEKKYQTGLQSIQKRMNEDGLSFASAMLELKDLYCKLRTDSQDTFEPKKDLIENSINSLMLTKILTR